MVPIQFLFVSACMVVVMRLRCKTHGKEYPSTVPVDATSVLELQTVSITYIQNGSKTHISISQDCTFTITSWKNDQIGLMQTKWELKGLSSSSMASQFALCVKGTLYPERKGKQSQLKGHLEMGISLVRQPLLGLIPDSVLEGMAETVRINITPSPALFFFFY